LRFRRAPRYTKEQYEQPIFAKNAVATIFHFILFTNTVNKKYSKFTEIIHEDTVFCSI
jgi:hypothetical protein